MNTILGMGTYSIVKSQDNLAVKIIQHENFESAIREISLIRVCNHENVIKILRTEFDANATYLYMKKYNCDLYSYKSHGGLIPVNLLYKVAHDIIAGCVHIHSRGIIHGDIKPRNILIEELAPNTINAVICDFGIAVVADEKCHTGRIQTCTYRAPEVIYDKPCKYTNAIDVWSIGCILLTYTLGCPVFDYIEGVEDPTIYACTLFKLPQYKNRRKRMKILNMVTDKYILKCIVDIIPPYRLYELSKTNFINLIAFCLHPNPRRRISSLDALNAINKILTPEISSIPPVIYVANIEKIPLNEIKCVAGVNLELLSQCSEECLIFAENIYRKYVNFTDRNLHIGVIFIATCIFSNSMFDREIIENFIEINDLIEISIKIMKATGIDFIKK